MIEKILTYIFFPPGGLVVLLIAAIVFVAKNRRRAAIIILSIAVFSLYFLSTKAGSELLISPLENSYHLPEKVHADVIVVLGGGFKYCPEGLCVGDSSIKRATYALLLQQKYGLPIVVCGGKLFEPGPTEAATMANFLERLGGKNIVIESKSINTWQQAIEVKEIMEKNGWKRAVLVTSAFHMKRAVYSFKRQGIEVVTAPTDYRTDRSGAPITYFLPYVKYLFTSFLALHEYAGILYYKIR